MKQKTSFTLSPDALRLIAEICKQLGVNKSAVIEIAIRALAEKEKVR